MLVDGAHDSPPLLEQGLIVPVRVDLHQKNSQSKHGEPFQNFVIKTAGHRQVFFTSSQNTNNIFGTNLPRKAKLTKRFPSFLFCISEMIFDERKYVCVNHKNFSDTF